jgi:hypothetical protein
VIVGVTNYAERNTFVINNQEEFNRLVDLMGIRTFAPINIDFNKSTVIAVFMGEQSTGGYGTEIKKITEENGVTVYIRETSPLSGSPVTTALTQPFHIVKTLEKINEQVNFIYLTNPIIETHKFMIMHRTVKYCKDNSTKVINGVSEQIIPVGRGTSYWNFKCENRYQEQCIADGTFDTYYDEWCEERSGNIIVEVTVYNDSSTVKITKAGEESVKFVFETQDLDTIVAEIRARTGLSAEEIRNNLVLRVKDYDIIPQQTPTPAPTPSHEQENETENKVCCKKYGFGAYMEKVNIEYEWEDECETPQGFVGGGMEIVSDEYCMID